MWLCKGRPIGLYSTVLARESGARTIIVARAPRTGSSWPRWGADHVVDIGEVKTPEERKELILGLTGGRRPRGRVEASGVPPPSQKASS
jgi:threonine dehydrogenase-like Zn-dependent dehydrogenase